MQPHTPPGLCERGLFRHRQPDPTAGCCQKSPPAGSACTCSSKGRKASTVKPVYGLLAQASGDAPIYPLVLVAFVLQEVLQQVQHLCHLQDEATTV